MAKKKYDASKKYVAIVGISIDASKDSKALHYKAGETIKDAPSHFDWEGFISGGAIEVIKGGK
jgi:hypothetical protein|tara:strand:- start:5255 stop:5443 length:189 start_codon:yes stop_codon:yes gene_type:complete